MQEHWDVEKYKKYLQGNGRKVFDGGNRSKYGAKKTNVDGITFDSKKEAEYYCDLKLQTAIGEIDGFCMQPVFILAPNLKYKADFIVFNKDGSFKIVDTKGFKTKEYIAKKKVLEDKYNLKIVEV
jgi:hypothetical protein